MLKDSGVHLVPGVTYDRIDDDGLHVTIAAPDSGNANGSGKEKANGSGDADHPVERRTLAVDHVVVCAGQESVRDLYDDLLAAGVEAHLVGGADVAAELDAKRAIEQGTRVAASL